MIRFDERGNLFPYQLISISLNEFQSLFVEAFEKDSTRYQTFDSYLKYVSDFRKKLAAILPIG